MNQDALEDHKLKDFLKKNEKPANIDDQIQLIGDFF